MLLVDTSGPKNEIIIEYLQMPRLAAIAVTQGEPQLITIDAGGITGPGDAEEPEQPILPIPVVPEYC